MKERFRIVTNKMLRDSGVERRIIEYNRERDALLMMIVGAVIVFISMIW